MQHQGVIGCDEAIDLIGEQIAAHAGGILTALAPFEAMSAIETWHGIIRDIEEFINVLMRSEEHTSELQSLMRISYAVFCLKKKKPQATQYHYTLPLQITLFSVSRTPTHNT